MVQPSLAQGISGTVPDRSDGRPVFHRTSAQQGDAADAEREARTSNKPSVRASPSPLRRCSAVPPGQAEAQYRADGQFLLPADSEKSDSESIRRSSVCRERRPHLVRKTVAASAESFCGGKDFFPCRGRNRNSGLPIPDRNRNRRVADSRLPGNILYCHHPFFLHITTLLQRLI